MAISWSEVPQTVLDMASEIIDTHHPELQDARVGFIFRSEAQQSNGKFIWGQAQKVSEKHKVFMDFDFLIWLAQDVWQTLNHTQKMALIDHELCHCFFEDDKATMRPHDVEEFHCIIQRYGIWRNDLEKTADVFTQARLPGVLPLKKMGAVLSVQPELMNE